MEQVNNFLKSLRDNAINFKANVYLKTLPSNTIEINLNDYQLTILPDLTRFTNLEELYCSHNELISLPDNILNHLPMSIRILCLDYNKLTEFPKGFKQLINLEFLGCTENKITSLENLPDSIRGLNCSFNNLTFLPERLPASLMDLWCNDNNLYVLPDTLSFLNSFEYIDCSNNKFIFINWLPLTLDGFHIFNNLYNNESINKLKILYPNLTLKKDTLITIKLNSIERLYTSNILENVEYIKQRNLELKKEKMDKINLNGILIETAKKWMMHPKKIESYLKSGFSLEDIYNFD